MSVEKTRARAEQARRSLYGVGMASFHRIDVLVPSAMPTPIPTPILLPLPHACRALRHRRANLSSRDVSPRLDVHAPLLDIDADLAIAGVDVELGVTLGSPPPVPPCRAQAPPCRSLELKLKLVSTLELEQHVRICLCFRFPISLPIRLRLRVRRPLPCIGQYGAVLMDVGDSSTSQSQSAAQ
ncbi:hypothetical protein B0H13DRAFT_2351776 [Mycena leptocephala]|nr:hypothetical protein B0H13DRAFT_2351776 [Mycena leptocephala]